MEQNKQNVSATFSSGAIPQEQLDSLGVSSTLDPALNIHLPDSSGGQKDPQEGTFQAFPKVEVDPGDVEGFLEKTARFGTTIEISWHRVKKVLVETEQLFSGAYLGIDPFSEKPRASRASKLLIDPITTRNIGDQYALELTKAARSIIAKEDVTGTAQNLANQELANAFRYVVYAAESAVDAWKLQQHNEQRPGFHDPDNIDGTSCILDIQREYTVAFALQHLYIEHITDFLQVDANVGPFVSRLQDIIELRKAGINECAGLLETINTLVTQQEIEQSISSLEAGIVRAGVFKENLQDFTRRVLTEDNPDLQGAIPKDFAATLSGVKMSFRALVGSGKMTEEDFVEAFTSQLPDMQGNKIWVEAHSADSGVRVQSEWRHLLRDIRRYERRGRVPDYIFSARRPAAKAKRGGSSKTQRRPKVSMLAVNELQDVVTPIEEILSTAKLTVMKSKGGTSEHTLEYTESLDELMEHTLLTNFLKQNDNRLTDPLRESVKHLQTFFVDYRTSKPLLEQFTLDDPNCKPHKSYRLRRFRPAAHFIDLSDPLTRRIRIIYGVVPSKVGNLLALKSIALRDESTY